MPPMTETTAGVLRVLAGEVTALLAHSARSFMRASQSTGFTR